MDGGELNTTGATVNGAFGVAIDAAAGRIYWANSGANKISYTNLDDSGGGGDLSTAGATVNGPIGLAIDPPAGKIYWANADADKISYANLDGSGGGDLNTTGATVSLPEGVAVDPAAGRVYWANHNASKISYANLDGSGGGDLNTSLVTVDLPTGVAVEPDPTFPQRTDVYWVNASGSVPISFVSVDGDSGADFAPTGATVEGPYGVALDQALGRIYWANSTGGNLSFDNLIGGGANLLTIGGDTSHGPNFPAILKPPSGAGLPQVSGVATLGSTLSCSQGTWASDLLGAFLYRVPQTFAYQWSLDGTDIPGATSSSIAASSTGAFRCRVTASNPAGAAVQTSDPLVVPSYRLTIFKGGSGGGTVMSSPSGIACGAACSSQFGAGTKITLNAEPDPNSKFAGWSGPCTGIGACQVAMKSDHEVSADFDVLSTPDTKITKTEVKPRKGMATFSFAGFGEFSGFQCVLKLRHKASKFTSCRSPKTYKHLRFGGYTFMVRAVGDEGTDPSPAKRRFRVG